MRTVIQRVQHASVAIDGAVRSEIGKGLLILVGFEDSDTDKEIVRMAKKIVNMRIFDDDKGVMNRSNRQPVYFICFDKKRKSSVVYSCRETGYCDSIVRVVLQGSRNAVRS